MEIRDYKKEDSVQVKKILSQYWTDKEFLEELTDEIGSENAHFYVAERSHEIVGIVGVRKDTKHLRGQSGRNSAELYVIASKNKNEGVGSALLAKVSDEVRKKGFTEIVCYSPETHKNSWKFYEKKGFTNHGMIKDPEGGYPGMLWSKSVVGI